MMKQHSNITQNRRLVYLIIYLIIFLGVNSILFDTILAPFDQKGFWFYTGIVTLIIGSLLVTPYYTSPVNGLSYASAALVALIFTKPPETTLWFYIVIAITITIVIFSFISILTINTDKIIFKNMSFLSKSIVDFIGNPRILYVFLLVYSVFEFHSDSTQETAYILFAGLIISLNLVERADNLYLKIIRNWGYEQPFESVGNIEAYQTPEIVLVKLDHGINTINNKILVINDPIFGLKLGFNLGYMGRDDNLLLRVMELEAVNDKNYEVKSLANLLHENEVAILSQETTVSLSKTSDILRKANNFLGIVDTDSSIDNITIEIINEQKIEEGSLLEVKIKGEYVMYQVIDGLTWEDIISQKNKYGYSKATARKIGKWNKTDNKFENVKWMPIINSTVFIKSEEEIDIPIEAIGTFPDTNYFVSIKDMNHLVTYNTAILGILGVGKSYLSIELTERMIVNDIKVICIDLTNQYEKMLENLYIPDQIEEYTNKLESLGVDGKTNYQRNKEEGGSINEFRNELNRQLNEFMEQEEVKLLIYNPLKFEVWKQTGGLYQDTAAMASLTPCEITQIIAESLLNICQNMGMSEDARVCIVFEEAHSLIPEYNSVVGDNDRHAAAGTSRAILQGRKYGLGCLLITQRTANVTKTILNQCNTIFALRTFDETGMTFLSNYFGYDYSRILSSIPQQQAVIFGKASSCENPVLIQLNDRDEFLRKFRRVHPIQELPEWQRDDEESRATEENSENETERGQTAENDDLPF